MLLGGPHRAGHERVQHTGVPGAVAVRAPDRAGSGSRATMRVVSTRTLLILAAITGVAILAAGAVQILLAR